MRIATIILAVIVSLLSIAAGAAKIALVPEELEFLQQFGFADPTVISFGIIQVLGGLMLFIPATRLYGAIAASLGFALSLILILSTGNFVFAAISGVPLVITIFVIYREINKPASPTSELDP